MNIVEREKERENFQQFMSRLNIRKYEKSDNSITNYKLINDCCF